MAQFKGDLALDNSLWSGAAFLHALCDSCCTRQKEREREKGRWVYVPELINPHNPSNCTVSTLSRSERACQPFCPRLSLSKFHYPLSPPPLPANWTPRVHPLSPPSRPSLSLSHVLYFTRSNVFHARFNVQSSSPFGIIHSDGGFASLPSLNSPTSGWNFLLIAERSRWSRRFVVNVVTLLLYMWKTFLLDMEIEGNEFFLFWIYYMLFVRSGLILG